MSRLRFRYSIRVLLLAVTLAAVGTFWVLLPTLHARRFVAAINGGRYGEAERLCVAPERAFPGSFKEHDTFEPKASVKPWSWSDFTKGQREIFVGVHYGDGGGLAHCGVECIARRRGIEVGMMAP